MRFIALLLALCAAGILTATAAPAAEAWESPGIDAPLPPTVEDFVRLYALPGDDAEALKSSIADAGANWPQLAAALQFLRYRETPEAAGSLYASAKWLVGTAPHLDRLELTRDEIVMRCLAAHSLAEAAGYDTSTEFFRRNLLNYRFDDEPVTHWEYDLQDAAMPVLGDGHPDPYPLAELLPAVQHFTVLERGYFGNLAAPGAVAMAHAGTEREISVVLAAILRDNGYPCRFASDNRSGKSWVEVYTGSPQPIDVSAWMPVYPLAPEHNGDAAYATQLCGGRLSVVTAGDAFGREQVTARYSTTGTITPRFYKDGAEVEGAEHWAITAWYDGRYVALDDLEYPVSEEDYPLSTGGEPAAGGIAKSYTLAAPGDYRLESGMRYPGGYVDVQQRAFHLDAGQQLELSLMLDAPTDLPGEAIVDRTVKLPTTPDARLTPRGRYLFVVYDDKEPSVRTREAFRQFETLNSVYYQQLDGASSDSAVQSFLTDVLQVSKDDPRPIVVLVVNGQTRLYLRGFNLNLADWVNRELGNE